LVAFVAALYASVGHGGASGYLAVLAFFAVPHLQIASTALVLNLFVASLSYVSYSTAGYNGRRLVLPFLALSVPGAFVGGMLHVSDRFYHGLLAAVLIIAAVRLAIPIKGRNADVPTIVPTVWIAVIAGGLIGLLSGVVGVGGGIFLSPLLLLCGWAGTKETASASAQFILVNSVAGLIGRQTAGTLEFGPLIPFIAAAVVGGMAGSYVGSRLLTGMSLRRMLALVLVTASLKLVLTMSW
jgi:hypothetical protein